MRLESLFRESTLALFFCLLLLHTNSGLAQEEKGWVPITNLFYHLDTHLEGSFMHNYGINHAIAISLTYGLVESGVDWRWNTYTNERGIADAGFASVDVGRIVPVAAPLALYLYGGTVESRKLQVAALAMGQAAIISVGISSLGKALTGRRHPDHRGSDREKTDYSGDFKFGFLNRGAYNGWPSSHTMTAFAAATALNEIYPENTTLHVASFAYASFIGLGVSTNIHWLSDVVAGALIGYSVGHTVGVGFRGLLSGEGETNQAFDLRIVPGGVGITYRF